MTLRIELQQAASDWKQAAENAEARNKELVEALRKISETTYCNSNDPYEEHHRIALSALAKNGGGQ